MKTIATAMMFLALGACHQSAPQASNATATPSSAADNVQRINSLPQRQRDMVFYRAIEDAHFECQGVKGSERSKDVQGFPVWIAHCVDGHDWGIILDKDGEVQVATPAQLRGLQASPQDTEKPAGNETGQ